MKRPERVALSRLLRYFEDDLALRYAERTVPEYLAHVRAFLAWMDERPYARRAQAADLIAYQSELFAMRRRDGRPYSVGFQVNRLSALKAFFGFLVRRLISLHDPMARLSSRHASRRGCRERS